MFHRYREPRHAPGSWHFYLLGMCDECGAEWATASLIPLEPAQLALIALGDCPHDTPHPLTAADIATRIAEEC